MDTLNGYRDLIENILEEYARIPYAYGDIQTEAVFDRPRDRYLLVNVGWKNGSRIHWTLVHVDIIDDKIWIQRDGTEDGIANDLVRAGVPKDRPGFPSAFRPAAHGVCRGLKLRINSVGVMSCAWRCQTGGRSGYGGRLGALLRTAAEDVPAAALRAQGQVRLQWRVETGIDCWYREWPPSGPGDLVRLDARR
jgi:hypothetical protein